jgi:hypothetical protein
MARQIGTHHKAAHRVAKEEQRRQLAVGALDADELLEHLRPDGSRPRPRRQRPYQLR